MRLSSRLLLFTFGVVGLLVVLASAAAERRAARWADDEARTRVAAEATLVARAWRAGDVPAALAESLAASLGRHVTLLDARGRVVGDSQSEDLAAPWLARYAELPEVRRALRSAGEPGPAPTARSAAAGRPELAAAARGAPGVVRIAAPADYGAALAQSLRRGIWLAGLTGLALSLLVALLVARAVTRPIVELRDVTRGLATGDLSRRPALSAPGEIGDLATAVHRLAEQLGARLDALTAEESLLVALTESLTEGVAAVDARQRVVRINAIGRQLLRLRDPVPFPADHLPRERALREALVAALAGEASGPLEVRLDDRVVSLTARPLAGGGAVLALYDVTTLRRLETMRRDFVANVSHELKTPITIVGGFAETLADDELPAEQRRLFAETIHANAQRMQRIVDDLLDLSRLESGGWRPNPTRVDLCAAAEESAAAAQAAAGRKQLTLTIDVGTVPTVHADPTAVRQILSNLVENAVRHTTHGSVIVYSRRDGAGTWLGVRDTGVGIAAEHLPRIFERFWRADPGRARDLGGTGLGLAIVKHLAEAHGGEVRATSAVGRGTTIEVRFPDGDN